MAGQTNSADDLIAELAKLMAEDAQSDQPKREQSATVRIPGGDAPVRMAETAEQAPPARPIRIPGDDHAPRAPVEAAAPRPEQKPASTPEPFVFDFDRPLPPKAEERPAPIVAAAVTPQRVEPALFTPVSTAAPAKAELRDITPAPKPRVEPVLSAPVAPAAPVSIAPQDEPAPTKEPLPDLDGDSLADLIAAELAIAAETVVPNETPDDEPVDAIDVTDEVAGVELPREADVFGVPPVFGLGSGKPVEPTPALVEPLPEARVAPVVAPMPVQAARVEPAPVESDPLAEIERLIGPAAHVQPPAAPSPALRSLATPTIPQKEPPVASIPAQSRVQVNSVEEAILSAAATSGAQVEWVEPVIAGKLPDDEPVAAPRAPRRAVLGMTRSVAGPLVATLLLAVAAVGLYTVLGLGGPATDGPAPLLAADTTPVKEIPQPAPDASATTQSVVFNEISGVDQAADEQIVSRDQADVEAVTQVAAAADVNQEGLVNRKVRTVTVRPDGTIVSGNDSLAGSAMLPVDRPQIPDVPGADFSTPDLIANAAAETSVTSPEPVANTLPPVQPGSTVPAVDLTGTAISGLMAPVPLSRPSTFTPQAATPAATLPPVETTPVAAAPVTSTPTPTPATTEVAVAPAPQQTATPAATTSSAPAYVQLSSQRTEDAARQTAQDIASRFGSLFGGANLEVQRVDLGERGIFYRVRVPADSLQSANAICSSVKANGGDCFTL